MSTCPRDPLAASVASTSPRYWSRVLQTDQAFHRDTVARRQAGALDKWRIDHLADPASSHARQELFDLCRDDPTRSLHALRASQPTRDSPLQEPSPTLLLRSSLALDLLCKSPKAKFVKAQCRVSVPKMRSSMLPGGSSNIRGARGHKQIRTRVSIVNHWDTGAVSVQGSEAHMVARQMESSRSRPLVSDTPDVAWQTHQRRRARNAVHAIPQIHPSSGRHTDIATSDPPSASTPAHYPSHFSALAPPDTDVDESEFPFGPWDGRQLLQQHHVSKLSPTPFTLVQPSHNQTDGGTSGYVRFLLLWLFPVVSPLGSTHAAKCEHDFSFALKFFYASSPSWPSAHTTWYMRSLQ